MAKNSVDSSRPGFEWLYPDLLTKEQLVSTLKQRYIKDVDLDSLSKEKLVELYNKYIIPLPQRKYRKNRRGREMIIKQIKMNKKRRAVISSDDSQPPEKRKSTGKLLSSFDLPQAVGDRLKPPPSCIDMGRKTIKIGTSATSSSESTSTVSTSLNKMKLTKSDPTDPQTDKINTSPNKVKLKNITKDVKPKVEKTEGNDGIEGDTAEKTVDKENPGKEEPMEISDSDANEEVAVKKKIKIKRIAWP